MFPLVSQIFDQPDTNITSLIVIPKYTDDPTKITNVITPNTISIIDQLVGKPISKTLPSGGASRSRRLAHQNQIMKGNTFGPKGSLSGGNLLRKNTRVRSKLKRNNSTKRIRGGRYKNIKK